MGTNTNSTDFFDHFLQDTPAGSYWEHSPVFVHVMVILMLAIAAHLIVSLIHHGSDWIIRHRHIRRSPIGFVTETPKFVTLLQLVVSAVTFGIYFIAAGLVLITLFHFSDTFLKTYLSSAAVVGLALSFGLQGLVQDVVTGVTLILSNAIDVGDVVDLSGTIGRVEQIGLRFTKVINFYNQEIFVPNRNIANVARFPHSGIYAYADVQISPETDADKVAHLVKEVADGAWTQFRAIILDQPDVSKAHAARPGGWKFLRVQFKIWPGQTLIETVFRPQMVAAMKALDANYADWMVPVTYRAMDSDTDKAGLGQGITT